MKCTPARRKKITYPTPYPKLNDQIWEKVWKFVTEPARLRSMAVAFYDSLAPEEKPSERELFIQAMCRRLTEDGPTEELRRLIFEHCEVTVIQQGRQIMVEGSVPVGSSKREVN